MSLEESTSRDQSWSTTHKCQNWEKPLTLTLCPRGEGTWQQDRLRKGRLRLH
jgi:hypothetical protein